MVLVMNINIKKAYTNKMYFTLYITIVIILSILIFKFISPQIYGSANTHTYFLLLIWVALFMAFVPKLYTEAEKVCPINWHPIRKKWIESCNFVERQKDLVIIFFILSILVALFFFIICYFNIFGNDFGAPQKKEIEAIQNVATFLSGNAIASIHSSFLDRFSIIFTNNIKVAVLFFLLSVFEMFGALFLLTWNSSLLGVWLSEIAKQVASQTNSILTIITASATSILGILPHTIFEFSGFFLAAIAGGIFSIGFKLYEDHALILQIKDSILVLLAGLFCIFIGALIEAI